MSRLLILALFYNFNDSKGNIRNGKCTFVLPIMCVIYIFVFFTINADDHESETIRCITNIDASMFIMQYIKYLFVTKFSNEDANNELNDR